MRDERSGLVSVLAGNPKMLSIPCYAFKPPKPSICKASRVQNWGGCYRGIIPLVKCGMESHTAYMGGVASVSNKHKGMKTFFEPDNVTTVCDIFFHGVIQQGRCYAEIVVDSSPNSCFCLALINLSFACWTKLGFIDNPNLRLVVCTDCRFLFCMKPTNSVKQKSGGIY